MTRADQLAAAEREAERRRLEHRFAVKHAEREIWRRYCMSPSDTGSAWFKLHTADMSFVEDEVRYLDLCGLLERREGEPDVVRVRGNA